LGENLRCRIFLGRCYDSEGVTRRWFSVRVEARSWTQPHPPVLAAPDAFLHLRLYLDDAWLNQTGEWIAVRDATTVELWSILGYLRWHAPTVKAQDPKGSPCPDSDGYLASRPLVAAIDAELARRGEIAVGEGLACLRAIGPSPWEMPHGGRMRHRSRR
jgi:hypothetical protein